MSNQNIAFNVKTMTMPGMVAFTNLTFGNKTLSEKDDPDFFWKRLQTQMKIIQSEVDETRAGIEAKDYTEVRDGIADMLVTVLGLAHIAGVDAMADLIEVTESNLSKVSPTTEDAADTMAWYLFEKGIETKMYKSPTVHGFVVKVDGDQTSKTGESFQNGKFLKSVGNYRKPVFAPIPE